MGELGSAEPFRSAEEAWFWTVSALDARAEGVRPGGSAVRRPCDPDDVLRCLDRLYRAQRIRREHAEVLRRWGAQRLAPGACAGAGRDALLWAEALDRLAPMLAAKGVIQEEGKKSLTYHRMSD